MRTIFSGLKPTGSLHLGSYLGAIKQMVALQDGGDRCVYAVMDLHSLTVEHDPARLRPLTFELAGLLLASGIDPERSTLFVQSHVSAHTELAYVMETTANVGELRRMTQFKDKANGQQQVRAALFTYPALMAADILAYDTDLVPVGDDQRQHLELARTLAERFNSRYGETFVVPEVLHPANGARVMDLVDPTRKMGKTGGSPAGSIQLLDPPDVIARKIARATTDAECEVRYNPTVKPGVSNLLTVLAALNGEDPGEIADRYASYADLKRDVTDVVVDVLRPIQAAYAEIANRGGALDDILRASAAHAAALAAPTLARARHALGLVAA